VLYTRLRLVNWIARHTRFDPVGEVSGELVRGAEIDIASTLSTRKKAGHPRLAENPTPSQHQDVRHRERH
jgi:hypothetical protein